MADTGGGQNYNETNESQKGKEEKQGRNSGEITGQQSKEEKKKGKGMMKTDKGKQSDRNEALGAKDGSGKNVNEEEIEMSKRSDQCRRVELERLNQYMEQVKIELMQTNEILKEEAGVKEERIVMFEKHLNEAASEKIRLEEQIEQLLQALHNEREDNKNLRGKINEVENTCECRRREMSVQQAQTEHEEGIKKLNLTKSRDDLRDSADGEKDSMADCSDAVSGRMPDSSRTQFKNNKIISQRINDGNPDLTDPDLSDENRATKLAERYSELFDNQWTDAFEEIQSHLAPHQYNNETVEKKAISILLQALKEAIQFCECEIKEQDVHIKEALLRGSKIKMELPEGFVYQLKQTKKFLAEKTVDVVCQNFLARKSSIENFPTYKIETFVTECVKISWLMVNHDPPIVFDVTAKPGDSFDSKKYKEYTKRGPKIDFLVWPPMQIEGYSLFMKGIAQGKPEFVEETEIYSMKETVASRLNFQTGTRKTDADDQVNTVAETTKFRTDQRERKQAWTVAYKDKNDIGEYERGYNERQHVERAASTDPLTTGIRPNGHNESPQDRNHDLHTARRTRAEIAYSEIPPIINSDWKRDNKNYSRGKNYTDSTGVDAFMQTVNYDMSSSRRNRALYTGGGERYDGTCSPTRRYKDHYHKPSPSKADEYQYQSQKYTEVNDVEPQTLEIQDLRNEDEYKQRVIRPIRQTSHKTYDMSRAYYMYDKPNATEWQRYLEYKKGKMSRIYIKNSLGEPSFNRCENWYENVNRESTA